MKKKCLQIAILLIFCINCFGQNRENGLTENEWNKIVTYLNNEQWKKAEKLTKQYIKQFEPNESLADPAILRYMYLRCVAAQLGENIYDKKTALKKIECLKGKKIITPPTEVNPNRIFNGLKLSEDTTHLTSCATNNKMTVIHCFENYYFADSTIFKKFNELIGKNLRIEATIKEIEVVGVTMPSFKVLFKNSFIWDEE